MWNECIPQEPPFEPASAKYGHSAPRNGSVKKKSSFISKKSSVKSGSPHALSVFSYAFFHLSDASSFAGTRSQSRKKPGLSPTTYTLPKSPILRSSERRE